MVVASKLDFLGFVVEQLEILFSFFLGKQNLHRTIHGSVPLCIIVFIVCLEISNYG